MNDCRHVSFTSCAPNSNSVSSSPLKLKFPKYPVLPQTKAFQCNHHPSQIQRSTSVWKAWTSPLSCLSISVPDTCCLRRFFFLERDISNYKVFFLQDASQNLQLSCVKTSTITFQGLFHRKIIFPNLPHYPALAFLLFSLCTLYIFLCSCPFDFTCGSHWLPAPYIHD